MQISLKKRARQGHPWVFSNELEASPKDIPVGSIVDVLDGRGKFVGRGFGHPNSLISVRIARWDTGELNDKWLRASLQKALARRQATCRGRTAYRWVHAESDGLPGLIVDRYGDRLVLSANSAAMDQRKEQIIAAIRDLAPDLVGAVWRNDGRGRVLEGLDQVVETAWGDVEGPWTIDDDGIPITFDPTGGQKTGLFLDMWENRRRMAPVLGAGRVADLFCYVGQWGLHAARAGASEVVCVDRSEAALGFVRQNAEAAGVKVETAMSDVTTWIDAQPDASFDAIVCDPPSFIRSRKQAGKGANAYGRLFAKVLTKVRRGGLRGAGVVLSSPLQRPVPQGRLGRWLQGAARGHLGNAGRSVAVPPSPHDLPEARYLKTVLVEAR